LMSSFGDNDEGMIFALLPSVHLGVAQQMTSHKEALMDTINSMRGNPSIAIKLRNNEKELQALLYSLTVPEGPVPERRTDPDLVRQARVLAENFAAQEQALSRATLNSFVSI